MQAWLVVRRPRGRARRRVAPLVAGGALLLVVGGGVAGALALRSDASATAPPPAADVTSATTTTATPLGRAADELARLMAVGDARAALAFIDGLPPDLQANEQVRLARALTCLELGLRGVTGGERTDGDCLLYTSPSPRD